MSHKMLFLCAALVPVGIALIGCKGAEVAVDAAERDYECESTPVPRWVLRDKDGKPVQALVEPRCGMWNDAQVDCLPIDFGASSTFPCVRVVDHRGQYVNAVYELSSGTIGPCYGSIMTDDHSWDTLSGVSNLFDDEICAGPHFGAANNFGYYSYYFTRGREIFQVEGEYLSLSGEGCTAEEKPWVKGFECTESDQTMTICLHQLVPDWAYNLLPNPPYTLAVEYE